MAKVDLTILGEIEGFLGACLVDLDSGMVLGKKGGGPVDLDLAAAGNTQVVRAKMKTMDSLGLQERIEDILISLQGQYHIIRPLGEDHNMFLYVVLDRNRANLALSRHLLKKFEAEFKL